jgi:hypothetical protein
MPEVETMDHPSAATRLGIALIVALGCASAYGFHVEGYSAAGQTLSTARRVEALGGAPAYYDMDEPLFFGHY